MPRLRASGPDVDVRDVRGLAAAVTEHAEDEAERRALLFGDQRDALATVSARSSQASSHVSRRIRLVAELLLELVPELADEVVVGFGCGSDRHW